MRELTLGRSSWLILAVVMLANLAFWAGMNRPRDFVPYTGVVKGVSLSPYQKDQDPIAERFPAPEDFERDMRFLQGKVAAVRLYSSLENLQELPRIADKYGIQVTAGAWLDKRIDNNRAEIAGLIKMARNNKNVRRVVVGNESIMRADVTVKEMIGHLRHVRGKVKQPVSTAETWDVWLANPELAKEVDYISIHVLPYWEGIAPEIAVDYVLRRYREVKEAYPDKHVTIGEVGWPSDGRNIGASRTNRTNQARVIREFLAAAQAHNLDYYVIEAFDQPWKYQIEGLTGAYWGIWGADRDLKFSFSGSVLDRPNWAIYAAAASLLSLLPILVLMRRATHLGRSGHLFFAVLIQIVTTALVWTAMIGAMKYMTLATWIVWGVLLTAQMLVIALLLSEGFALAEILFTRRWRRSFKPFVRPPAGVVLPKVSIHLPICNEPPAMVAATLDSLARLDYPDFEVIVIDNNTKDPAVWRPVEAQCAQLGPRFKFLHFDSLKGFKAGALNVALRHTAPDAAVIGVIDSDYVVEPRWLRAMAPYFTLDPKVGFVQSPQDHRDWQGDAYREMSNWEYAGFFHGGMVQRNEYDAIIQHGTMTLIRREALADAGGWSEWCICEDSELGLRLMERGWRSVYSPETLGRGLVPDNWEGYKRQRFRWAYGAMQILKGHWRQLLPGADNRLTAAQKFQFVAGWSPWFADALNLFFVAASLLWTVGLVAAPKYFEFPLAIFVVPTIGMFAFKLMQTLWLYQARVPCSPQQRVGAAIAGMSLAHVVGLAVVDGLLTDGKPFIRTPKGGDRPAVLRALVAARDEAILLGLLLMGIVGVLATRGMMDGEARIWATVLAIQAVPYAASVFTSLVSALPQLAKVAAPVPAPAPARALTAAPAPGDD
ncbi:MAG: glycosyltransferase [Alphaproteobacteria bacterium]|nr:glycosyltransferase [Alphaproteobacteria bacterium]